MSAFSVAARWFSATQALDRRRRDPWMTRKKRSARSRAFAAMLEPLEDRTVMNVTVTGAATNTITFTSDSASDNLSLQTTSSGALTYTDSSATTAQSTGFTVGNSKSITVIERDSGGTLNLQNVDTHGGSLTINNALTLTDVTVTGSLTTGAGAVTIDGSSVTVSAALTTEGGAVTIDGSSVTVSAALTTGAGAVTIDGSSSVTVSAALG